MRRGFFGTLTRVADIPIIAGYAKDVLNRHIDVFFDPNVFSGSGGPLQAADVQLIFTSNGGTATACTITSLTQVNGSALVGGEQTVRFNLSITGDVLGVETIEIRPVAQGSYKTGANQPCRASDTTGVVNLDQTLDPLYRAGLLTALSNGLSVPPAAQRTVHNNWFVGSRADGSLTEWDALFLLDYTTQFARINFMTGALVGTIVNSPLTTQYLGTRGVRASGSFINTNWIPNAGVKFTELSNSIMVVISNNAQDEGFVTGGRGATNLGHNALRPRNLSNQISAVVNANAVGFAITNFAGQTDSRGTYMVTRQNPPDANTLTRLFRNGVQITTGTNNLSTRSSRPMYICAKNDDGTTSTINENNDILMVAYGSGSQANRAAAIHSRNQTYISGLEALLPSLSGRLYGILGQSNADYSDGLLTDLSPSEAALYNNGPISIANGYAANCYIWWNDEWQLLEAGVNGVTRGTLYFGPIYPLAVAEAAKYPGEDLFFIKESIGGSGMYTSTGANNWLPGGASNSRYEVFKSKYNAAVDAMTSVTAHMPVWWFQGEQDALVLQQSIDYGPAGLNNEQIFMNAVRADTGFEDFIVSNIFSAQPGFPANIRTAKQNNFNNGLYGTGGALLYADDLDTAGHFTPTNCIVNAIRVSDLYP